MEYSKKLIDAVKEVFPTNPKIIEAAEKGYDVLGRYLDDITSSSISITRVLQATSLEELQKQAKIQKQQLEVYSMWYNEARE